MRYNIGTAGKEEAVAYVIVYSKAGDVLKCLALDKEFASDIRKGHERASFLLDDIEPAVLGLTPCGDHEGCGPDGVCYGCYYETCPMEDTIMGCVPWASGFDPRFIVE